MEFKRRLKPMAGMDLIPMIDVVFQLILFFMVASTFIVTPGLNLSLPKSVTSEPVLVSKWVVTIVAEDEVYLNKERFGLATLGPALAKVPKEQKEKVASVTVEGDEKVSYRLMVQVLDVLRREGFRGVGLKTLDGTR